MYHDRPHMFYLTQALDNIMHWTVVIWSQEHTGRLESLIDYVHIHTRTQKVLPEKILALWRPREMMKETIHRKTLLRSGGSFRWALAVCIGVGFRLQYL